MILPALLAVVLLAVPVRADEPAGVVVTFLNGGSVEGLLAGEDESRVRVDIGGGSMWFYRDEIESIRPKRTGVERFYEREARVDPNDAGELWDLVRWAKRAGLGTLARKTAGRVLEIEPGHAPARELLGFAFYDGMWMTRKEALSARAPAGRERSARPAPRKPAVGPTPAPRPSRADRAARKARGRREAAVRAWPAGWRPARRVVHVGGWAPVQLCNWNRRKDCWIRHDGGWYNFKAGDNYHPYNWRHLTARMTRHEHPPKVALPVLRSRGRTAR